MYSADNVHMYSADKHPTVSYFLGREFPLHRELIKSH